MRRRRQTRTEPTPPRGKNYGKDPHAHLNLQPRYNRAVAIGSAFRRSSDRLIERLKPAKTRMFGTSRNLHEFRLAGTDFPNSSIDLPDTISASRETQIIRMGWDARECWLIAAAAVFGAATAMIWRLGFQLVANLGAYGASYKSYWGLLDNTWSMVALLTWPIVALLGLAAVWVMVFARVYREAELPSRAVAVLDTHYRFGLCVLAVIIALLLAAGVIALRAFPNSGDEYAYLFEVQTFRAGRLWNVLPPVPDAFASNHVLIKDGKWVSQYPPGWPIIIAGVTSLGLPAYVASPVMALLLLLGFARLARELVSPGAALVGTALLACCPFFLLNGASYFSHVPAALFGVLAVLCGVRFLETAGISSALAAGAALGFLGIIRPLSAVLVAIPCGVELLRRAGSLHYTRLV